ncbi:hypothetical protein HDU67_009246 [Dinochytrium kinnereticum]|nr:hypothetical protein HDU67_009246 [Dinochytrium kinnereticum]
MSSRRPLFIAAILTITLIIVITVLSSTNTDTSNPTAIATEPEERWEKIVPADGTVQIAVPDPEALNPENKKEEEGRHKLDLAAEAKQDAQDKEEERKKLEEGKKGTPTPTATGNGGNATITEKGSARKPAEPMMSKMGNETLKAELGRAAWRLLHTMAGKFPYKPTEAQKDVMRDYIYLFAQLYPCGDCARHFKMVLEAHPPVVEDRISLSQWACEVHNVVNKRLSKPIFDCKTVLEHYKCGCSEDDVDSLSIPASKPTGGPKTVGDLASVRMLGRPKEKGVVSTKGGGVTATPTSTPIEIVNDKLEVKPTEVVKAKQAEKPMEDDHHHDHGHGHHH